MVAMDHVLPRKLLKIVVMVAMDRVPLSKMMPKSLKIVAMVAMDLVHLSKIMLQA